VHRVWVCKPVLHLQLWRERHECCVHQDDGVRVHQDDGMTMACMRTKTVECVRTKRGEGMW
jgi:hypothetical protein